MILFSPFVLKSSSIQTMDFNDAKLKPADDNERGPPLVLNYSDDSTKADTYGNESPMSTLRRYSFLNQPRSCISYNSVSSNSTERHVAIFRKIGSYTDTDTYNHTDSSVPMVLNQNLRPHQLGTKMKTTSRSFDSNESSTKPRKRRRLKRILGRNPYWTSQESVTSESTHQLPPPSIVQKSVSTVEYSTTERKETISIGLKDETNKYDQREEENNKE